MRNIVFVRCPPVVCHACATGHSYFFKVVMVDFLTYHKLETECQFIHRRRLKNILAVSMAILKLDIFIFINQQFKTDRDEVK